MDLAMIWLCKELSQSADRGRVLLLDDVCERYKELAEESSTVIKQSFLSRSTTAILVVLYGVSICSSRIVDPCHMTSLMKSSLNNLWG